MKSTIQRFNTILYCRRWTETVAFYRDRLGFPIACQWDWLVEFRLSSTTFLSVADQSRTSMTSAGGQGITLSFQTDRLDRLHRALIAEGLTPTAIRAPIMGGAVFYLHDPEGTRIEFWEPLP